ncbi:helix-turn-helix domain-containing protein [Eisenbergiella tayi]|uniref:helix-turn-helix domain-containing protein n=1 Tax=Eisenbergiella tayi TaxID=1432052 RepID=UPI00084894A2|nr:helix-turn-helix transcriptional regulator [Eisenbergiella tayi]ODR34587.1 transcriptional regulator [Eisenbergiella tayi]
MISYVPFWKTLKDKKVTQYQLVQKLGVSKGLIYRIKKNDVITTHSINKLCSILDCNVEDIILFTKDSENP